MCAEKINVQNISFVFLVPKNYKKNTNFGPVIASSVSKYLAVTVETTFSNGLVECVRCLQFCTRIFIPICKCSIRTSSC